MCYRLLCRCHNVIAVLLFILYSTTGITYAQPPKKSLAESERYPLPKEKDIIPAEPAFVICIDSQDELVKLNNYVRQAIKTGRKNIEVIISSGTYYYNSLPIYLYDIDAPDVCLSIRGNTTIMIAGGNDYSSGNSVDQPKREYTYLNRQGICQDLFSEVLQTEEQVEILDVDTKLCRVKAVEPVSFCKGMSIQLSEWFRTGVYPVSKIEDGYIFFLADDLSFDKGKNCYNVNYDYGVSKLYPRYRIWTPDPLFDNVGTIHECTVHYFLCLYRIKLKCFSLSKLYFNGAAKSTRDGLLIFRDVAAEQITIKECTFENINNRVLSLKQTDNVVFKNNILRDCMYDGVYSFMDCKNTIVRDNSFSRMEKAWTNCAAVSCFGKNFLISNNQFEDCGYSSISVGVNKNWTKDKSCSGVIERNHIWYGDVYFNNGFKYNLIDGGAIYVATMNDRIIIRYNYIHNISGPGSNRAIYCDDGAMNIKIYGNVIRDIPNGHAIFSWRAKGVNKEILESNDGIDVFYNVIWGRYKFDERERSSCIHGKNLVLYDKVLPENTLVNFAYKEEDSYYQGASVRHGKVKLGRKAKKELESLPIYSSIKHWIK